jgi:hypothetical protein
MSKELISYLKLFHGTYNTSVLLLFVYQGILGWRIRKSVQKPLDVIRKHRKIGPVAAVLGVSGFIAGTTIIYLDTKRILVYAYHFITGLAIVSSIIATYIISRKIRDKEPNWRTIHFVLGMLIIALYFIQAFLGLGILL